jgi:uncharacterized membrane protein (UPF0127 family)
VPRKAIILGILFVALAITFAIPLLLSNPNTTIGNKSYKLEVADTAERRQQGLSGREELKDDAGMLFVFDEPGRQCFWMKDMKFSIDILWLDANKKVVELEKNVAPRTYPDTFCADKAQYAIELKAGQIRDAKVSRGQIIDL